MGQDPGTGGTPVMGAQEPDQLRDEIDVTRQELGDTVEALAEKTDVKAQTKRKVEDTKASVGQKKEDLLGKAKEATPDQATAVASQLPRKAREHPIPTAVAGAFLAGFLAGRLSNR